MPQHKPDAAPNQVSGSALKALADQVDVDLRAAADRAVTLIAQLHPGSSDGLPPLEWRNKFASAAFTALEEAWQAVAS